MTSMAGNSASSMHPRGRVAVEAPRMRSTMNAEIASTSSTLPSSDGWKRKNGELDPALGAARGTGEREDEQDRADHQP